MDRCSYAKFDWCECEWKWKCKCKSQPSYRTPSSIQLLVAVFLLLLWLLPSLSTPDRKSWIGRLLRENARRAEQ